jgi:hypothetical protein
MNKAYLIQTTFEKTPNICHNFIIQGSVKAWIIDSHSHICSQIVEHLKA